MNLSLKMPIVTRNQRKNFANVVASKPATISVPTGKTLFGTEMKELLFQCESSVGKENKMNVALKIYEKLNKELSNRIAEDGLDSWIKFIAAVYSKTIDFIRERDSGDYFVIDKNIVENFFSYVFQVRNFTSNIIKNYCGCVLDESIRRAKEEITRLESGRPRRNIPRVNYTGMDTIEPESEFDGITDIWFDLTQSEDPDYEFEEDEDDEEEPRWAKIHPELSVEEKTELKEHLAQLVHHHRVRRNVARVNYTGMDMSEEDEGQIHIAKRRFEDGKVKYIWKSYSLSEANEIGDEEYVDE